MAQVLEIIIKFLVIILCVSIEMLIIVKLDFIIPFLSRVKGKFSIKGLKESSSITNFILLIALIGFMCYLILIVFNNRFDLISQDAVAASGQFGDSINGISAPFIGLLGAILIYLTLRSQVKANKIQKELNEYKNLLDTVEILRQNKNSIENVCTAALVDLRAHNYQTNNLQLLYIAIQDIKRTADMILNTENYQSALYGKLRFVWEFELKPLFVPINNQIVTTGAILGFTTYFGNPMTFNQAYAELATQMSDPKYFK